MGSKVQLDSIGEGLIKNTYNTEAPYKLHQIEYMLPSNSIKAIQTAQGTVFLRVKDCEHQSTFMAQLQQEVEELKYNAA